MVSLPPLVDHYVQGNEEGFEVHAPPFGSGRGGGGEIRDRPDMFPRVDSALKLTHLFALNLTHPRLHLVPVIIGHLCRVANPLGQFAFHPVTRSGHQKDVAVVQQSV